MEHLKLDKNNTYKNMENIIKDLIKPFNLNKAPLFRVSVLEMNENKYILFMDMHHIISDGTSMGIMIKEFVSLYEGMQLPELNIRYRDYSVWHNKRLQSEKTS